MSALKNRRRRKAAAEVFKKCPACQSPNILTVEEDVFCTYCDWHSVSIDAPAEHRSVPIPMKEDSEPARPGSLAAMVEKILEENPFLTGDPVFA